jgi:hypothetical protein
MAGRKNGGAAEVGTAELVAELLGRLEGGVRERERALRAAERALTEARTKLRRARRALARSGLGPTKGVRDAKTHGNAARPGTTLRETVLEIIRDSQKPIRTIDVKARAAALGYSVASVSTLIKFHAHRGTIRQSRYGWWEPSRPRSRA